MYRFPGHPHEAAPWRRCLHGILQTIRRHDPQLEIGLCLEELSTFDTLGLRPSIGRYNSVL